MTAAPDSVRDALSERYRVGHQIGRGATATVYLAEDTLEQRLVAIKVLKPELAEALGAQRFLREIRFAASLQHPNLVAILDSGEVGDVLYYVAPYLEGGSLRARLERERQLAITDAVRIARDVGEALQYAHVHGIIHRDVKPENILFAGEHACIADFGIARALDAAVGDTITSTGLVVGTPAYMSPEQGSGDRAVDSRSDQYSLACVLYEMIAGVPPFIGASAQAVIAQRFAHSALPLSHYRPTVPPHIEAAVARALCLTPADRYGSVEAFIEALGDLTTAEFTTTIRAIAERAARRRWFIAGVATALVVLAVLGFRQAYPRLHSVLGSSIDTALYAVIPVSTSRGDSVSALAVSGGLYDAARLWDGLPIVNENMIREALPRDAPPTLEGALRTARRAGAGRLLWGAIERDTQYELLRARLYDVAKGTSIKDTTVTLSPVDRQQGFSIAVRALLRERTPPIAAAGDLGTRSYPAWLAYSRGHAALARWEIARAEAEFGAAIAHDGDFVHAHLWVAQLRAATDPRMIGEWQRNAAVGVSRRELLSARETLVGEALQNLARREYPAACRSYERLVAVDSRDALAWYGAGECRFADREVVRDEASPNGWRFRADFAVAARAYLRAIESQPGILVLPVFDRLQSLLPTNTRDLIPGQSRQPELAFWGHPILDRGKFSYVAHTQAEHAAGTVPLLSPAHSAALVANRDTLLRVATAWVRGDSLNYRAFAALAGVLEKRAEVLDLAPSQTSALAAIRRARALATSQPIALSLGVHEARILLKRGEFTRARALADSLLRLRSRPSPEEAGELAPIAALVGRAQRAAELMAGGDNPLVGDSGEPTAVRLAAARVLAYAALGACSALATARAQLESALATYVERRRKEALRKALLELPTALAGGCEGGRFAIDFGRTEDDLIRLHQGAAARRHEYVRATLATIERRRAPGRYADVSLDYIVQEAELLLAIGDTAAAVAKLDASLEALPAYSGSLLTHVPEAAALPRAMMLRVELRRPSDAAAAQRWRDAVVQLWSGADQEIRARVAGSRADRGVAN